MPDINGALKLLGLPDLACFKSFKDFLAALPSMYAVVIPDSITNVTISNIQPLDSESDHVWFRMSNGGDFIGIYLFSNGSWQQRYPAPGEVSWIVGDSNNPPPGFILTDDAPWISSPIKNDLKAFWRPTGSGPWNFFTVVPAV